MNLSHSHSLRSSLSLECITHYRISCRNQMQTLSSATEQIGFVEKCTNRDILFFFRFQAFTLLWLLFLFFFFVLRQQSFWHHCPWIWARVKKNVILTLTFGHRVKGAVKASSEPRWEVDWGTPNSLLFPYDLFLAPPLSHRFLALFLPSGEQSLLSH